MSEVATLSNGINIYSEAALEGLKVACTMQAEIRDILVSRAVPGITTLELDMLAEALISKMGAKPLFIGYRNYPYTTCMSCNEQIVHGFPTNRKLEKGDVLSIDLGLKYNGFCADSARTTIIGEPKSEDDTLLIQVAMEAFEAGVKKAYPGNTIGDIGFAIHKTVVKHQKVAGNWSSGFKFKIFSKFTGHGVGLSLHEPPDVPNFGAKGKGKHLYKGMCICIEPVVLYASSQVTQYTEENVDRFKTTDLRSSSHYENQVYISSEGPVILT